MWEFEFYNGFIIRCDLVISANGKTEKIASGLVNPFLAHLKTAQDQMAKGGYSIILEPHPGSDATWFTKGTVERFVLLFNAPSLLCLWLWLVVVGIGMRYTVS